MQGQNIGPYLIGMGVGLLIMGVIWYLKSRGPRPMVFKSMTPQRVQQIRDNQVRRALQQASQQSDTSWRYVSGVRKNGLPFVIILRTPDIGAFLSHPDGTTLDRQGVVTLEEGNFVPWYLQGATICQLTQLGFDNDPWLPPIPVDVLRPLLPPWIRAQAAQMAATQHTVMMFDSPGAGHATLLGTPGVREDNKTEIGMGSTFEPPPEEGGGARRAVVLPPRGPNKT